MTEDHWKNATRFAIVLLIICNFFFAAAYVLCVRQAHTALKDAQRDNQYLETCRRYVRTYCSAFYTQLPPYPDK